MGGRSGSSGGRGRGGGGGGSYKTFGNVAADEWSFTGDSKEQEAWFAENSNYDQVINEMDGQTRWAFNDWANGELASGQQYAGWDNMERGERKITQLMDDALDKAVLNKGVTIVRSSDAQLVLGKGKSKATLQELQAAEGSIVTSKGAMSFSAAQQGLTINGEKSVEYRLSIPGGTVGSGMWIGDKRLNREWGADQLEYVVNRDVKVRVGKTTFDATRDMFVTNLEYVGREAHDYGTRGRMRL